MDRIVKLVTNSLLLTMLLGILILPAASTGLIGYFAPTRSENVLGTTTATKPILNQITKEIKEEVTKQTSQPIQPTQTTKTEDALRLKPNNTKK